MLLWLHLPCLDMWPASCHGQLRGCCLCPRQRREGTDKKCISRRWVCDSPPVIRQHNGSILLCGGVFNKILGHNRTFSYFLLDTVWYETLLKRTLALSRTKNIWIKHARTWVFKWNPKHISDYIKYCKYFQHRKSAWSHRFLHLPLPLQEGLRGSDVTVKRSNNVLLKLIPQLLELLGGPQTLARLIFPPYPWPHLSWQRGGAGNSVRQQRLREWWRWLWRGKVSCLRWD